MKINGTYLTVREIYEAISNNDETLDGKEVIIDGWVRTNRLMGNLGFISFNDGTCFKCAQLVYNSNLDNFELASKSKLGQAISIEGIVHLTPSGKQPFEIELTKYVLVGDVDESYPLQKKKTSFEYLRTIPHLRPRANTFTALYRVRSVLAFAIHEFFQGEGFIYVHTPIFTSNDCEGAGQAFKISTGDKNPDEFFGKPVTLTVSGQLHVEPLALTFRDVYTFGPTFRAEKSSTTRHAAEFWMVEPEIAFADLEDDMELAEDMLKYVIKYVMDECPEEMAFFNQFVEKGLLDKLNHIVTSDFGKVTYTEAVELLKNCGKDFEYPVEWGMDLQTEHERYLTEEIFKKPVFVTDYPKDIKAFYMRLNDDGKTVAATDCLVPGIGEIIGGSQREERLDVLKARMAELGLKEEDYWWYLELRKYGETKHAGFGLGFERLIMYITGMSNIRDVIPFPRTTGQSDF